MERFHFDVVESTNDYAKEHLKSLNDGVMIDATFQTKGRGRLNHTWESRKDKNVLVSFVLKPKVDYSLIQQLSQVVAKSLMDLLDSFGVKAFVKWPNDIYVDDKKIAGILIETVYDQEEIVGIVAGIGLNVFSDCAVLNAIALNMCIEVKDSIEEILFKLYERLMINYHLWLNGNYNTILKVCNKRSYLKDKLVRFNNQIYWIGELNQAGNIKVINEDGIEDHLLVNELSLHHDG